MKQKIGWRRVGIEVGLVGLIAFLAYARFLGVGFTGRDLPGLLWRFRESALTDIFSMGLLAGGTYFRPLAALSFHLNYQWFGLNPLGYHVTDISLHVFSAVLTYAFVRVSFKPRGWVAPIAGIIVAIHPAAIEVVPNISNRMDSMVTVFVLLTLCLFARALRPASRPTTRLWRDPFYLLAVVAFVFATLSKEIGFVTIAILGWYVVVMDEAPRVRTRLLKAVGLLVPFILLAGLVLWWRSQLFGDALGGVVTDPFANIAYWLKERSSKLVSYVWFLLFPSAFNPGDFGENQLGNFLLANRLQLLLLVMLGCAFVATLLKFFEKTDLTRRAKLLKYFVFLAGWLGLPFAVFMVTLFRYRYIYFSIPPMAIGLALAGVMFRKAFVDFVRRDGVDEPPLRRRLGVLTTAAGMLACGLIAAQLIYFSPLVQAYDAFEQNGTLTSALLGEFASRRELYETAQRMEVENLPAPQWNRDLFAPQPRELGNIWIPAYFRLVSRNDDLDWCVESVVRTSRYLVPFHVKELARSTYLIEFDGTRGEERFEYGGCCQDFSCK